MSLRDLFRGRHSDEPDLKEEDSVVAFEIRIGTESHVLRTRLGTQPQPRRRRRADASPEDCWHPGGAEALVAGRRLDGLVYVGRNLAPADERSYWLDIEPSLIDPTLPVGTSPKRSDPEYIWPLAYEGLAPDQRAAYLDWLAGGRVDPGIGAVYIELFASGLERRALADTRHSPEAATDFDSIMKELDRLLVRYGDQRTSYKLRSFANVLRAPSLEESPENIEPPAARTGWEPPLELRIRLGAFARSGNPLPADWALSWARCSPDSWLRTPAQRCAVEFNELFALRYRERYPAGLKLKDLKQRLTVEHHPINQGLQGPIRYVSELPDIVAAGHLANPLRRLAQGCTDELDAYSRFLGRQPEAMDELRAVALLPRELLARRRSQQLDELRSVVAPLARQDRVPTDADPLIAPFIGPNGKLAKKDAVSLARLLESLDVGIEPDVRFGGEIPVTGQPVVLFRLSTASPEALTPEYSAAAALLHMAVAVAAADNSVSTEEEQALNGHAVNAPELEQHERERLVAHLDWLLAKPPSLRGIKARVAQIQGVQRETVAAALLAIAGADGVITPGEVQVLTKLFNAMGFEEALLYRQLHALTSAPATDPVTVRPAEAGDAEFALPTAPQGDIRLDRQLIDAKLAETATVSALLAGIFADDDPPPPTVEPPGSLGLDRVHHEFLRRLGQRNQWTRAEVESAAADLQLLPDGALEVINEAAFNSAGAPVWRGEDPVEIDASVLEELIQ